MVSNGPVWYRGYFNDKLKEDIISDILNRVSSKHLVVGHCSNNEVISLYGQKILGVDSSIKKGSNGELLFIIDEKFYRGTKEGVLISF